MAAQNVLTSEPDEVTDGGTDFRSMTEIDKVKTRILELIGKGFQVLLHMAPPCSTFSRARDRSSATQLRSKEAPAGDERDPDTAEREFDSKERVQAALVGGCTRLHGDT